MASVVASVEDPGRDCEVNVMGTLNVVEVAARCGASVVFTSTGGALYGDDAPMPTGEDRIPAAEALRMGLVNRVVPAAELDDATLALAEEIAKNEPFVIQTTKRAVNRAWAR